MMYLFIYSNHNGNVIHYAQYSFIEDHTLTDEELRYKALLAIMEKHGHLARMVSQIIYYRCA